MAESRAREEAPASSVTDRQLLSMNAPRGNRLSTPQRWLMFGLLALLVSAGLLFAYRQWQASQPTDVEIARTEVLAAHLASNPMLEGYRQVITDVRVEFQSDPSGSGYYLCFDTALTQDDLAFAEGIYTHFTLLKSDHPELAPYSMVFILDESGRYLFGGAG